MDPHHAEELQAILPVLLERFYDRVRADAALGPVFEDAVEDWDHHLSVVVDFWSSVMLGSGRYKGNPVQVHLQHGPRIGSEMFGRWLALWNQTTDETVSPEVAAALQATAARIARSLDLAINFRLPKADTNPPPWGEA